MKEKDNYLKEEDSIFQHERYIKFLYWQLAWRKFNYDNKTNVISKNKFENIFFNVFKAFLRYVLPDNIEINGIILDKETAIERYLYDFYRKMPYICNNIDYAIEKYHQNINDNPALDFTLIFNNEVKYFLGEAIIDHVIHKYEDDIKYLLNVTKQYGLFPNTLITTRDMYNDYITLTTCEDDPPDTFYRDQEYSKIISTNFISYKSGKCYFKEPKEGKLYVYCDYKSIDIIKLINCINVRYNLRKNSRANLEIWDSPDPNMQLEIDIADIYEKKEIVIEAQLALMAAKNYFNPLSVNFEDMKKLYKRTLNMKYKKISYLKRCVGLYIWDIVNLMDIPLYRVKKAFINLWENPNDKCDFKLPDKILNKIKRFVELLKKDEKLGKEKIFLDEKNLEREYRLAKKSIETLSIEPHKSGRN